MSLEFRLLSGAPVQVAAKRPETVGAARNQVALALKLSPDRIKLITPSGTILEDDSGIVNLDEELLHVNVLEGWEVADWCMEYLSRFFNVTVLEVDDAYTWNPMPENARSCSFKQAVDAIWAPVPHTMRRYRGPRDVRGATAAETVQFFNGKFSSRSPRCYVYWKEHDHRQHEETESETETETKPEYHVVYGICVASSGFEVDKFHERWLRTSTREIQYMCGGLDYSGKYLTLTEVMGAAKKGEPHAMWAVPHIETVVAAVKEYLLADPDRYHYSYISILDAALKFLSEMLPPSDTIFGDALALALDAREKCSRLGAIELMRTYAPSHERAMKILRFRATYDWPDVRRLALTALSEAEEKGLPCEGHTSDDELVPLQTTRPLTEYGAMCDWARTPKSWAQAVQLTQKVSDEGADRMTAECADGQSSSLEVEEPMSSVRNALTEAKQLDAGIRRLQLARDANIECFERWWKAMEVADTELRSFGDPDWQPKHFGGGSSVLFQEPEIATPTDARVHVPGNTEVVPAVASPDANDSSAQTHAEMPAEALASKSSAPTAFSLPVSKANSVVTLHTGGAGCSIGMALWKCLRSEAQILEDGRREKDAVGLSNTHFEETMKGCHLPRTVFVDNDLDGGLGAYQSGWFAPESLISANHLGLVGQDSNTWASFYKCSVLHDKVLEQLRKQIEKVDTIDCLIQVTALHAHFGGGVSCKLGERIRDTYGKASLWNVAAVPAPAEDDTCAAVHYNTILALPGLAQFSSLNTFVDDAALAKHTNPSGGIFQASDDIVGKLISSWTASLRFCPAVPANEGTLGLAPSKAITNLVPFPRLRFTVPSYMPNCWAREALPALSDPGAALMCTIDYSSGSNLAGALFGRGMPHVTALGLTGEWRENKCKFVDHAGQGFQLGSHSDPLEEPGHAFCLFNNSAIGSLFERFHKACQEEASIKQQYLANGLEEDMLCAAQEDVRALIDDYQEHVREVREGGDGFPYEEGYGDEF